MYPKTRYVLIRKKQTKKSSSKEVGRAMKKQKAKKQIETTALVSG